jgi:hypothetical protein
MLLNASLLTLTATAFHRRKCLLRCLVVAVGVMLLGLPVAAILVGPAVLSDLLLLLPLWFAYLAADALAIGAWRRRIVNVWLAEDIDLGLFRARIVALPMLPAATIGAMISTLPETGLGPDATPLSATRRTLAAASDRRWRGETTRALLPIVAAAAIALSLRLAL